MASASEDCRFTAAAISDGGLHAWLQCLGSFFLLLNSFGLTNSFGVFQTFYETNTLSARLPSDISWIGSVQSFLLIALGVVAGPIYDRGHLRMLLVVGSFLVVTGTVFTGLCNKYWQLMLAQGVLTGTGAGLLFLPSIAILSQYFQKNLAFATGLSSSGSAIGSICYPILFNNLEPRIGFRYATWLIALIMLITLGIAVTSLRFRLPPGKARKYFDTRAWLEIPFSLWAVYLFISLLGLYIPSFYIQLYGLQFMDRSLAFYLLPVLNSGSFFGRILPLYLSDHVGHFNVLIPFTALASLMGFMWVLVRSVSHLFVYSACYGFLSGAITTVTAPIDVTMCPSSEVVGVRLGMLLFPWALGLLVGTPVGGAILGQQGSWLYMQIFVGSTLGLATIVGVVTRLSKHGGNLKC